MSAQGMIEGRELSGKPWNKWSIRFFKLETQLVDRKEWNQGLTSDSCTIEKEITEGNANYIWGLVVECRQSPNINELIFPVDFFRIHTGQNNILCLVLMSYEAWASHITWNNNNTSGGIHYFLSPRNSTKRREGGSNIDRYSFVIHNWELYDYYWLLHSLFTIRQAYLRAACLGLWTGVLAKGPGLPDMPILLFYCFASHVSRIVSSPFWESRFHWIT